MPAGLPVSGIGGVSSWRDAAEFILLGCGTVQVCTAAMHYGFRIVEDMIDGLANWMREKGFATLDDFRGRSLPKDDRVEEPRSQLQDRRAHQRGEMHRLRALLHGLLGRRAPVHSHGPRARAPRGITMTPIPKLDAEPPHRYAARAHPRVDEAECVGCNLCALVCPVEDCITMERIDNR